MTPTPLTPLTEEELDELERVSKHPWHSPAYLSVASGTFVRLLSEVRARRAADAAIEARIVAITRTASETRDALDRITKRLGLTLPSAGAAERDEKGAGT